MDFMGLVEDVHFEFKCLSYDAGNSNTVGYVGGLIPSS